ncbi:MAG: hypothetical protein AAF771_07105 [Pseudomonadota bacterium]
MTEPELDGPGGKAQTSLGQPFDELALGPFEKHFLDTARRFIIALTVPESLAWVEAFRRAELAFPAPFGATIANAILIAVSEMQRARLDPAAIRIALHCSEGAVVTEDEHRLISAFQAVRLRRQSDAYANALLLCDGGSCRAFLAALERIAIITGDVDVPTFTDAG